MDMRHEQAPHLWQRPIMWLLDLLLDPDFYMTEIQSSILAVIWGALLLNPLVHSFDATTYRYMASIAPEPVWGALMVAIGAMQIIGALRRIIRWRMVGLMLLTCLWFFMALLLFAGSLRTVVPLLCLTFSLATAWAYFRLSVSTRD